MSHYQSGYRAGAIRGLGDGVSVVKLRLGGWLGGGENMPEGRDMEWGV